MPIAIKKIKKRPTNLLDASHKLNIHFILNCNGYMFSINFSTVDDQFLEHAFFIIICIILEIEIVALNELVEAICLACERSIVEEQTVFCDDYTH